MAENELDFNEDQMLNDLNLNEETNQQDLGGPADPVGGNLNIQGQRLVNTGLPGKTVKIPRSANIGSNIPNTLKLDTYQDVMAAAHHVTRQDPLYGSGYRDPKPTSVSKMNKYTDQKYGYMPNVDLDDLYGKDESWYETAGKIIPRFAINVTAKTLQGAGYIGGLLTPSNWGTEEGVFSKAADNALAKVAKNFEEISDTEWFPTFQEAADREKGFWARAFTDGDFWADDVVDGLAFMASAWIPGIGLSKLGIGAKAMRGIGGIFNVGSKALGATIEGAEKTANYFRNAKKAADGLDAFSAWSLATTSEAMYEASGVRDDVIKSLSYDRYGNPIIDPQTGRPFTEEEKRKRAGDAAQNTFLMNALVLGGTNVFEYKIVSRMFNKSLPVVGKGIVAGELGEQATIGAAPSALKTFSKTAALGVAREGFVEENMQLAIQRYNTKYGIAGKVGSMLDLSTYGDVLSQYTTQTGKAILGEDPEAAANIGIGGILGSVIPGIMNIKKEKKEYANSQKILAALNESQNQFIKPGNIFKTEEYDDVDDNGNPFKSKRIYLDDNARPVVDEDKLAAVVSGVQISNEMLLESENEVNKTKQKFLRAEAFGDLVTSYINAGIEDSIIQKLDKIRDYKADDIAKLGFFPDETLPQQLESYKNLASSIIKQNKILNNDLIFDNSQIDNARKSYLTTLATKQAVRKFIANDVNNEITSIKTELVNSDNSSLSDGLVDQLNEIIYRIESQKATIAAIKEQNLEKFFPLDVYENVLSELESSYEKLKKDNETSLSTLKKSADSVFYDYEKNERNEASLRSRIESRVFRRGELLNEIRNTGLTWSRYADLRSGKNNYASDFESIIEKHKELKTKKDQQEEAKEKKKEQEQTFNVVEADNNTFSVVSPDGTPAAENVATKEEAEKIATAINEKNATVAQKIEISPDATIEEKREALKKQIDNLPDDVVYATHITDEQTAKKIYDTQFSFSLGSALQGTFSIASKESLYKLLSDLLDGKSPHRGYTGLFLVAFPYSEFGTPSEEKKVSLDSIEDDLLYEYPEMFEGKIPTKFNFGYFKDGILTTRQDSAPSTKTISTEVEEKTLQQYLDEKHAKLSENPDFKVPYDQWINSPAINSHIKDYNKQYNKNEPLFGEKSSVPPGTSTDATVGIEITDLPSKSSESLRGVINIKEGKGHFTAKVLPDGTAYISDIQIGYDENAPRGKGYGFNAYIQIGKKLKELGYTLESTQWDKHTSGISPQALRVWEKLANAGYAKVIGQKTNKVYNRETGEEEVKETNVYKFVDAELAALGSKQISSQPQQDVVLEQVNNLKLENIKLKDVPGIVKTIQALFSKIAKRPDVQALTDKINEKISAIKDQVVKNYLSNIMTTDKSQSDYINQIEAGLPINNPEHKYGKISAPKQMLNTGFQLNNDEKAEKLFAGVSPADLNSKVRVVASRAYVNQSNNLLKDSGIPNRTIITMETESEIENKLTQGQSVIARTFKMDGFHINIYPKNSTGENVYIVGVDGYAIVNPDNSTEKVEFTEEQRAFVKENMLLDGRTMTDQEYDMFRDYYLKMQQFQNSISEMVADEVEEVDITDLFNETFTFSRAGLVASQSESIESLIKNNPNKLFPVTVETEEGTIITKRLPLLAFARGTAWSYEFPLEKGETIVEIDRNTGEAKPVTNLSNYIKTGLNLNLVMTNAYGGKIAWIAADSTEQRGYKPYTLESMKGTEPIELFKQFAKEFKELKQAIQKGEKTKVYEFKNKTFNTQAALLKDFNRFHYGFFSSKGFFVDISYNPATKKFLFEMAPSDKEKANSLTPAQKKAMHLYFKDDFTKLTDTSSDQEVEDTYNNWINSLLIDFDSLHKKLLNSDDAVLRELGNSMGDYHVLFNYEESQNKRTFYLKLQDKNAKKNNPPVSFLYYNSAASKGGNLQVAFNDVLPSKKVEQKPISPTEASSQPTPPPTNTPNTDNAKKPRTIGRKITNENKDDEAYMLREDEEAYEEYTDESFNNEVRWLASVLRSSGIELKDLGTIINNLRAGKQVLGYYKDQAIYVNKVISKRGVIYHEAFHGLFRNIMTANQRNFYLERAKEVMGVVTLNDIVKFRNERGYFNKTDNQIYDLMAEEYLADGFMRFKLEQKDPKYSWFKRFVRTIERIINFFLNNETAIESLYKDFDAGRYASNKIQAENISDEGVFAIATGRPKLHLDKDENGDESFTSDNTIPLNLDLQNELINKLAYSVANDAKDGFTQKFERAIERVKADYDIETLVRQNPDMAAAIRKKYQDRFYEASFILGESVPYALTEELTNEADAIALRTELGENKETLDIVRKAVQEKIKNLGLEKGLLDTDLMIPEEDEEDIEEKLKTGEFDTIHMNPLEGISSEFRSLFSMIPYTYEDRALGVKVEKMADGKALFNATIKVAADTPVNKILPSLAKAIETLEEDNDPNTIQLVAFRDFLNREFGMDIADPDALPSKNIYLYKQFIDTFFVTELPSYQIKAETTKVGTDVRIYDATINHDVNNKKDAIAYYFESSYRNLIKPEDKVLFQDNFKKMQDYIKDSFLKHLDSNQMNKRSFVNTVADELKELMDAVNIKIPKSLIRQSMLAIYTIENGNTFNRNSKENIRDINVDQRLMKEKAYLEKEFFLSLSLIQKPENFAKIFAETKESTAGLGQDLKRVKQINTILKNGMRYVIKYDITNPIQVYQNAELKNVWRYSRYTPPILLTQMVREAGSVKPITDLYPILDEFFADNKLFDGSLENQLFLKNLYVSANGGFRQEVDKKRSEGVTFGHIDTKALLLSNIVTFMNRKTLTEDIKDTDGKYKKTSITTFLRSRTQEEATTTNFFITGKYDRYVTDQNKPNEKFIQILVDGIRQEYNRIKREWSTRDDMDKVRYNLYNNNVHPETKNKIEGDSFVLNDKVVNLRAYQFKMFEHFFDEQKTSIENETVRQRLKDLLRDLAKRNMDFEQALENDLVKTHLEDQISKYMDETFENYLNKLLETDLLEIGKESKLTSTLIPKNIKEDADVKGKSISEYGYTGLDNLLYDHHLNVFANKFMVNQIFDGDIATGIKSGVEYYKRNKSGVISGNSGKTGFFRTAVVNNIKSLIDNLDLTKYSEDPDAILEDNDRRKKIDIADGQSYHTINHRLRLLDSWGRVDPRVRYLLSKYKHSPLLDNEVKELSNKKITLNSMKTATGGVFEYYKLSEHLVSRVDVSHMLIPDGMSKKDVISILDDLYSEIELLEDQIVQNPNAENAEELQDEISELYTKVHQYWMPKRSKEKLHYLLNSMELSGVDQVFDPNSSKKTTIVPVELNSNTVTNLKPSKSSTYSLFKFLQVETSGIHTDITLPTQARQILTTYIHKLKTDSTYKNMTLSQLAKEYNRKLGEIASSSLNILEKSFTNPDGSINYVNLYKMMHRGLKEQGASSNDLKFFEIKNGQPVHNPNLPRIKRLFTYYYFSMFSNNVFSNKVSGRADFLVSSYGQEILYDAITGRIITTTEQDENPALYQDRSKYKTRHLGVSMDVVNGKKVYTVEVIIPTPLAKNEAEKELFLKKLNMFFSTRIPTEDKRSMIVSKVVDYMDSAYQNSIVVPQLIHILSGSDLDIDKLYSHTFDHYLDYNDMPHVYGDYSGYRNASQGRFIEYINYMQNSKILKDAIAEEIERVSENPVLNYDFYKFKEELGVSEMKEYTFEELKEQRKQLIEVKDILQKQKKEAEERMNMLFESHLRLNQRMGSEGRRSWQAARNQYKRYDEEYQDKILELEAITEEVEKMQNTIKLAATLNVLTTMRMPVTQSQLTTYLGKTPNPVLPVLHNESLAQKIAVLSNEDVFNQYYINERSTTDNFKDVAISIGASVEDIVKQNSIYSILGDVTANELNSSSKDSLGIAAAFNKFLSFAEKTGLTLPSTLIRFRKDGVNYEYSTFENDNGVRRTGESIGMFADAAKDPIPSVLNLNPTTAGVSNVINAMTGDLRFGLLINKIPFIESLTQEVAKQESAAQESGGIMKTSIVGELKEFIKEGIGNLERYDRLGEYYELDDKGQPSSFRKIFIEMVDANPDFVNLENPATTDLGFKAYYEDGSPVAPDVMDIYLASVYSKVYSLNSDITNLTKILNLIKKQKPDFSELDSILFNIDYFMSGDSRFGESIVQILAESKEYAPLIQAIKKLDEYSRELLLERSPLFTAINKILRSGFNNTFGKRGAAQNISDQIGKFIIIQKMKAEMNYQIGQLKDKTDPTSIKKYNILKESYKYFSADTWMNSDSFVKDVDYLYDLNPGNPFVEFIKINNRKGINFIEASTRMKMDKDVTENILNGYEALQKSDDLKTMMLSRQLFYYLLIKDGLGYSNNTFLNYINGDLIQYKEVSDNLTSFQGLLKDQVNFITEKIKEYGAVQKSGLSETDKKKAILKISEEMYENYKKLLNNFFRMPDNKLDWINGMVTKIFSNASNQQYIKPTPRKDLSKSEKGREYASELISTGLFSNLTKLPSGKFFDFLENAKEGFTIDFTKLQKYEEQKLVTVVPSVITIIPDEMGTSIETVNFPFLFSSRDKKLYKLAKLDGEDVSKNIALASLNPTKIVPLNGLKAEYIEIKVEGTDNILSYGFSKEDGVKLFNYSQPKVEEFDPYAFFTAMPSSISDNMSQEETNDRSGVSYNLTNVEGPVDTSGYEFYDEDDVDAFFAMFPEEQKTPPASEPISKPVTKELTEAEIEKSEQDAMRASIAAARSKKSSDKTEEKVKYGKIENYLNGLSKDDRGKLGTLKDLIAEFEEVPFTYTEENFIDDLKCRLV